MVREFSLLNEKNQKFSFMDIYNYCLLTEPSGLGVSVDIDYAQLGNVFVTNTKKIAQGQIGGTVNFINYDNYKNLVDFIARSERLKLLYSIPFEGGTRSYYRDVNVASLGKTELGNTTGILSEPIVFDCLSLWYEPKTIRYQMEKGTNQIIWDFEWNSRWIAFNTSNIDFTNDGHVPAAIQLEIPGEVVNPELELYLNDELIQTISITSQVSVGQTFEYSSKENDFYIKKILSDGTEQNLFSLDNVDFSQDLIIRLPQGQTSTLKITADTDIESAILTIFVYYKAV